MNNRNRCIKTGKRKGNYNENNRIANPKGDVGKTTTVNLGEALAKEQLAELDALLNMNEKDAVIKMLHRMNRSRAHAHTSRDER